MPLRKGQTNNPNGRPPDSKVKAFRDAIREKQIERLDQAYRELDNLKECGKEVMYVELYLRLNKEAFPTMPAEIEQGEVERSAMSIFDKVSEMIKNAESKPPDPTTPKLKAS